MRSVGTTPIRIFAALAFLFLSACAAPTPPRIFWPPLPEQPRLEYMGVHYSENDFPKSETAKAVEKLIGKPPLNFFQSPFDVASDGKGLVYVSDPYEKQVKVFDFNKNVLYYLTKEPVFAQPFGLAVDGRGNLYVADTGAQAVRVFGPDHRPLFNFGTGEQFGKPVYLALNERLGRIYVSDGQRHQIVVFDLKGNHLFSFGKVGNGEGELYAPQGVAIDRENRVYVAEQFNARIQVFDAEGKHLSMFGERGDRQWQFEFPKDLAFDSDGNLHIVDGRKAALLTYRPDGTLLLFTGGKATVSPVGFALPTGIAIDANDRIYIADKLNRRFTAWQYLSQGYLAAHPIADETRRQQEELLQKHRKKGTN